MPRTSPIVDCVTDPTRAGVLFNPLRLRILEEAREPGSATEFARRLDESRQKVNYHVRKLARHGFLEPDDERRRGNLIEQRWRATASSWLLSPDVVGALAPDPDRIAEEESVDRLLALAGRLQSEVGRARTEAARLDRRLPTLSLEVPIRFTDAEQRAAFAVALREAVADIVARFASPLTDSSGESEEGRPYRLVLGCHPIPPTTHGHDAREDHHEPS